MGVSFDDPDDNQDWAQDEGFAFELWTDSDKTLALYYGSIEQENSWLPGRVTRVLDAEGTLVLEYDDVSISQGPQDVLEDCQVLFGE